MITPFNSQNVNNATYTCTFSGTYLRYDSNGEAEIRTLETEDELIIEPNSITYLQISETFRVPLYMVLRFNLKVKHVYKGLLLGTGPIVDPGFVGKLNIPLHNFTTNEYIIKRGADLIDVEFTKLSIKKDWEITGFSQILDIKNKLTRLNYSQLPEDIPEKKSPGKTMSDYIMKSLQEGVFHKKNKEKLSVGSSLAKYASKLNEMDDKVKKSIESLDKNFTEFQNKMDDKVENSIESLDKKVIEFKNRIDKTDKKTNTGLWIGGITLGVTIIGTIVALIIPIYSAFSSFNKERNEYQDSLSQYQDTVDDLEKRIVELELEDKNEKLDLLKAEFESFSDKQSIEAVEINNQITNLEQEIAELQKKLQ